VEGSLIDHKNLEHGKETFGSLRSLRVSKKV